MAQRKTTTKTKRPVRKSARAASRKTKSSSKPKERTKKSAGCGDEEVTIDRRRTPRREGDHQRDSAAESGALPTRLERRKKVNRRRQIDPTTCERDYTDDELQFMSALDEYKRTSGRMFPTCSEVLEVVRSLGYVKLPPTELAARSMGGPSTTPPLDGSATANEQP